MRFFIDYLWNFSETPHQQWAVFAERQGKTVLYFKAIHGKATANRVCIRARYDYERLGEKIVDGVMSCPEVVKKYGKKGQVVGYKLKE